MKRPSDQAKLLFFALLRGSATALATTGDKAIASVSVAASASVARQQSVAYVPPNPLQNIQLRLATRTDVPSLQRCNLACLPENYNAQFYCSHLRKWPELALVAEHVDDSLKPQQRPFSGFPGLGLGGGGIGGAPEPKIIAYVLGKVQATNADLDCSDDETLQLTGHVTSLAVNHEYRRQGLAQALMNQLHFHMIHNPYGDVSSCGLHVRASNEAACRLYQTDGYAVERTIPAYYQDGEDAYYMTKTLPVPQQQAPRGVNCWDHAVPQLRLPRRHKVPVGLHEPDSPTTPSGQGGSSSSPELLTGTM